MVDPDMPDGPCLVDEFSSSTGVAGGVEEESGDLVDPHVPDGPCLVHESSSLASGVAGEVEEEPTGKGRNSATAAGRVTGDVEAHDTVPTSVAELFDPDLPDGHCVVGPFAHHAGLPWRVVQRAVLGHEDRVVADGAVVGAFAAIFGTTLLEREGYCPVLYTSCLPADMTAAVCIPVVAVRDGRHIVTRRLRVPVPPGAAVRLIGGSGVSPTDPAGAAARGLAARGWGDRPAGGRGCERRTAGLPQPPPGPARTNRVAEDIGGRGTARTSPHGLTLKGSRSDSHRFPVGVGGWPEALGVSAADSVGAVVPHASSASASATAPLSTAAGTTVAGTGNASLRAHSAQPSAAACAWRALSRRGWCMAYAAHVTRVSLAVSATVVIPSLVLLLSYAVVDEARAALLACSMRQAPQPASSLALPWVWSAAPETTPAVGGALSCLVGHLGAGAQASGHWVLGAVRTIASEAPSLGATLGRSIGSPVGHAIDSALAGVSWSSAARVYVLAGPSLGVLVVAACLCLCLRAPRIFVALIRAVSGGGGGTREGSSRIQRQLPPAASAASEALSDAGTDVDLDDGLECARRASLWGSACRATGAACRFASGCCRWLLGGVAWSADAANARLEATAPASADAPSDFSRRVPTDPVSASSGDLSGRDPSALVRRDDRTSYPHAHAQPVPLPFQEPVAVETGRSPPRCGCCGRPGSLATGCGSSHPCERPRGRRCDAPAAEPCVPGAYPTSRRSTEGIHPLPTPGDPSEAASWYFVPVLHEARRRLEPKFRATGIWLERMRTARADYEAWAAGSGAEATEDPPLSWLQLADAVGVVARLSEGSVRRRIGQGYIAGHVQGELLGLVDGVVDRRILSLQQWASARLGAGRSRGGGSTTTCRVCRLPCPSDADDSIVCAESCGAVFHAGCIAWSVAFNTEELAFMPPSAHATELREDERRRWRCVTCRTGHAPGLSPALAAAPVAGSAGGGSVGRGLSRSWPPPFPMMPADEGLCATGCGGVGGASRPASAGAAMPASGRSAAGAPCAAAVARPIPQPPHGASVAASSISSAAVSRTLHLPPPIIAAEVESGCYDTVLHVPRALLSRWSGLLAAWLMDCAWRQRQAWRDGVDAPEYTALTVGPALCLRHPAGAAEMRARMDLAAEGRWVDLAALVESQVGGRPTLRTRRPDPDAARARQQGRARRYFAEGAVGRALRVLERDPLAPRPDPADARLLLLPKFPVEHRAGMNASLCHGSAAVALRAAGRRSHPPPLAAAVCSSSAAIPPAGSAVRRWVEEAARRRAAGVVPSRSAPAHRPSLDDDPWTAAVLSGLSSASRCAQPGPSGLRVEHIRDALSWRPGRAAVVASLTAVVDMMCVGIIPRALKSNRLFALPKPGGGVRPVGAGEVLRALAARVAMPSLKAQLEPACVADGQFGASPEGVLRVVSRVHAMAAAGMWVLSIDLVNAFNSISRRFLLSTVPVDAEAAALVAALYAGEPPRMFVPGCPEPVACEAGVIQGCPLASLLFAHAICGPIRAACADAARAGWTVAPAPSAPLPSAGAPIPAAYGVGCTPADVLYAYLADDGHVGSHDERALASLGAALRTRFGAIGLEVAVGPAKTALLPPVGAVARDSWLLSHAAVVRELHCLGVPCARPGDAAVARATASRRVADMCRSVAVAATAPLPQDVLAAVRHSGGVARGLYLLSAVGPDIYSAEWAASLDAVDAYCLSVALGDWGSLLLAAAGTSSEPVAALAQARLPVALGGLGIRAATEVIPAARRSRPLAVAAADAGDTRAAVTIRAREAERVATADASVFRALTAPELAEPAHRARLLQLAAGGGAEQGAWVSAPAAVDNGTLIANRREASCALALRLGLPVLRGAVPAGVSAVPCAGSGTGSACSTRGMCDAFGRHALGCSAGATARHNGVRDSIFRVLVGDGGGLADASDSVARGGVPRAGVIREAHCGQDGAPAVGRVGDRDGDIAVRVDPGAPWWYLDVCVRSMTEGVVSGPRGAAVDGAAAAASAYLYKDRRRPEIHSRGGCLVPVGVGAFGHVDGRSAGALRTLAAAADDADPVAPNVWCARPRRLLSSVATAVVTGGAAAVLVAERALRAPRLGRSVAPRILQDGEPTGEGCRWLVLVQITSRWVAAAAVTG